MSFLKHSWKTLNLSITDRILTISMNRPKANAMSSELLNELIQAFHQASNDQQIRGVHLRSNLNSTFCSGADLTTVYQLSKAGQQAPIDQFIFHTLANGMTAPISCSKPVACSLDGHTIAGGLMLALSCDYIAMGTRKVFRLGITGPVVGIPYPLKAVKLVQHQLEPQLAYRLIVDGQLYSSNEFPLRCARGENPDELARQWLDTLLTRPFQAFEITKKKWWSDYTRLDCLDNMVEKNDYFQAVTSNECLEAMEKALTKS